MSIILSRIVNSAPDKYKHPINYYVVPNRQIYGDFFRSVEATYYSHEELTDEYIEYIHPNYLLSVYYELDDADLKHYDYDNDEDNKHLALLRWYMNKEVILNTLGELMNIFETITSNYDSYYYIKEIPALVYDTKQKDWVISETKTEQVFITNSLSVRQLGNWDNLTSITGSQMVDIPFRIVQALHYFNNLVRAEKVPDWVYKIIQDYEAYRLLES